MMIVEQETLDELFQLFDLDHQLTEEKMKNAKKGKGTKGKGKKC